MSEYRDKEKIALWHELRWVYPDLAGMTTDPKEKKQAAERAKDELFGPDEDKEAEKCLSKV